MASQLRAVEPTAVELSPLRRISPSLGERLLKCELSAAFRLDGRFDFLRRPAPASSLGNISHALAEAAARGEFDAEPPEEIELALEAAWAEALAQAEQELADAHPEGAVPPASRWPGYGQTHVRSIELLVAEVRHRQQATSDVVNPLSLEESLEPDGVPLHGRADRVERHAGGVNLVDLKTGWTLPDELKPAHRQQLLTYAFLWHAVHGEWPRTASIQRLDGERLTFEVDPDEAESVASALIRALQSYNQHVSEKTPAHQLATPSPDACQFCSYRAACRPFFLAITPEWPSYRKSFVGRVMRVAFGRVTNRIEISVDQGNVVLSQVNLINVPPALTPAEGDVLVVVDAFPTRGEDDLRLGWESVVCTWKP